MSGVLPKVEGEFRADGLDCLILANPAGHRCGYVRVPEGHPWHGKDYDDCLDAEVHGGVTFGGSPVAKEREFAGWWIGFDCAHAWDIKDRSIMGPEHLKLHDEFERMWLAEHPGYEAPGETRTYEYVEAECRSLARQAVSAGSGADGPSGPVAGCLEEE